MQYTISHRMSDVHGSAIRELFKLGADPSMISFGGGNPSAKTFPVPEIAEIMADVMKNRPMKERHMLIRDRASITASTMPTVLPSSRVTGTPTTNCFRSYAPPMLLRPW